MTVTSNTIMADPLPTFLGIPRELREIIYLFVLVERPLLHRRHRALCSKSQLDVTQPEEPPCQLQDPLSDSIGVPCHCAKRRHLSLLLVSRQIHAEAAPTLWMHNTFTFLDPSWIFTEEWLTGTPDGFRELTRHIICLTPEHFRAPDAQLEEAWRVIVACRALRRLEIGCNFLEKDSTLSYLAELRAQRPRMDKITLVSIQPQRYICEGHRLPPVRIPSLGGRARRRSGMRRYDPACSHTGNIYVVVTHDFSYNLLLSAESKAAVVEWYADYLLSQVEPAFQWLMRYGCPGKHLPLTALGLCDTNNEVFLESEDGDRIPATLLGLPNSAETSMRNRVEREKWRKRRHRRT